MFESESLDSIDIIALNDVEIISLDSNKCKFNEISKTNSKKLKLNFDSTKTLFKINNKTNWEEKQNQRILFKLSVRFDLC